MHLHPLAQRSRLTLDAWVFERGNVGWWRRWRCAEDVRKEPPSAHRHRRAIGIGGDRQDARLAEEPAAWAIGERDAPEMAAVHIANPVMRGEPLVQKRIVGRQQLHDAAVVVHLAADKQLGLLLHRVAQVLVEFRVQLRVGDDARELAQLEPSAGEIIDQRAGPRIAKHAAHLLLQRSGTAQRSANCGVPQLVVRDAAPQKEGQARSQV